MSESEKKPEFLQPAIRNGPILDIASRTPIVVHSTTTIKETCGLMVDHGIRRAPVVDPRTWKLVGIISARDLVDFFGGGDRYKIVRGESRGDLSAAVAKVPVSRIMNEDVTPVRSDEPVEKTAMMMLEKRLGGCPVVDDKERVVGFISQRDFIKRMTGWGEGVKVSDIMSRDVVTAGPNTSILEAERTMISKGFRRLPVVDGGEIVGILRTTRMLKFVSEDDFSRFRGAEAEAILAKEKAHMAMSDNFTTVRPNDDIEELICMIHARRSGGFPVEEKDKLIGIVTEHDIFRLAYS